MSISKRGKRVVLDCSDKANPVCRSRTHQSFAKDADINVLMSRYKKTGFFHDPTAVNVNRVPRFGDFSDIPDFSVICDRIRQAEADFLRLPADIRAKFNNNVSECLDFIADPGNHDVAVELGLLTKPASEVVQGAVQKDSSAQPTPAVKPANT